MMRRVTGILLSALVACFSVLPASAQAGRGMVVPMQGSFLEPLQPRDSVLIADQLRYGVHLKGVAEGTHFSLPDYSRGFRDSVEVLTPWLADTVRTYGGRKEPKTYDIDACVILTSFDAGVYDLPPIAMLRHSGADRVDTLVFDPQVLDVRTMPVDTATFVPHDIKPQVRYPLTLAELLPYAAAAWAVAIVGILLWVLLARKRKEEAGRPADPPHVVALRRLDRYRGNKYWAPEKQKLYYSGITDTLREYMAARFGIDAMEMTTGEIFAALPPDSFPEGLHDEMLALFRTSDLVKFAKGVASDEENAAALPVAVRYVTATYQEQLAEGETPEAGEKGGAR